MGGSIAPAVRKAVADGLEAMYAADDEFNGEDGGKVSVKYAYDHGSKKAERVFTNRARAETPPAAMRAGRNHRDETGEFDLVIQVVLGGKSAEDVDERAFAIGAAAEEWLADRKSNELGVAGLVSLLVTGWESVNVGSDRGNAAELIYTITWRARLT